MKALSDVMAEAQRLVGGTPLAAMKLLLEERGGRPVSDAYEMLVARAAVAAGDPETAVMHLKNALAAKPDSAALRRLCGEVLLDLGRFSQAGEQLHLAVTAGAPPEKMPLLLKLAMQDYLRLAQPDATINSALNARVLAEYGVLDERNRLLYVYSPKVACTILKATVIMNSKQREDYLAYGKPIHEYVGHIRKEESLMDALAAPDMFRFAVLRDPATRIVSAYLNKFITNPPAEPWGIARNKKRAISVGQRLAGIEDDPERGISFEEFVHFLAQAHDLEMDPHWMPQSRIIGNDLSLYNHIGRFEALSETFDILRQRFGYVIEQESSVHLNGQKNHATKYSDRVSMKNPHQALPAELRRLGSIYPVADAFLTPSLRELLAKRFENDVKMHAAA